MFKLIVNWFKEPPNMEEIKDKGTIAEMYKHWSFRMFYATFLAYIVTHLCRKNIAIALPFIGNDLGFTNTQLGMLGASLYVTYGIGKFVNGVIADKSNVRTFLPTAFVLSAIANLCFVISTTLITPGHVSFFGLPSATVLLWLMVFFWGANGWCQSMVFPPIAKGLSYWLSKSERATKWSIWSTSHQFGVFLTVMLSGFLIGHFGWKAAFYTPAVICLIMAFWLYNRLVDKPQVLGLPDIDVFRNENIEPEKSGEVLQKMNYFQIFKKYIIFNKVMWLLAIAYAFVYVIRFGTEDWFVKYLMEYKGNSLNLATAKLSSLAVVGSLGAILAGWLSDKVFKGNRIPINIIFFAGLAVSLFAFHVNKIDALDFVLAALIGAFTAGPQLLLGGVCALEASSKQVASAALGFCGMFGYVGAVLSSFGTGFMVDNFGWRGAVCFWITSALIGITMCTIIIIYNSANKKKTTCDIVVDKEKTEAETVNK